MSTPAQELQIKIRTTAENRGATEAKQALDSVAQAAQKAGTQTNTAGTNAAKGLERVSSAAKRAGADTDTAGKTAAKGLGEMQRAGNSASQMFNGLEAASRGGIQGIMGLAQATRGFIGLVRTAVISTGPLGVLVTVLGLAAGAMMALRGRTKEAADELGKTGKASDDLKAKLTELETKAKESLQRHTDEVKKLAAAYGDVVKAIDAAEQRIAQANDRAVRQQLAQIDLEEQQALGAAKTDEEREKIRREFGSRREGVTDRAQQLQLENQLANATVRERAAQEAASKARAQIDAAKSEAFEKTQERQAAQSALSGAAGEVQSNLARQREINEAITSKDRPLSNAQKNELLAEFGSLQRRLPGAESERQAAAGRLKQAETAETAAMDNVRQVSIQAQQVIAEADQASAAVQDSRQAVTQEQQILATKTAARDTSRANDQATQIQQLEAEARAAANRGDWAGQDKAVAELRQLRSQPKPKPVEVGAGDTRFVQQAPIGFQIQGADGGGGSITRGGQRIDVGRGDSRAVAQAQAEFNAATERKDAAIVASFKEGARQAQKTENRIRDQRQ
jgi:hypothetical protein